MHWSCPTTLLTFTLSYGCASPSAQVGVPAPPTGPAGQRVALRATEASAAGRPGWRLVRHETFDAPFPERPWLKDTYGPASPYFTNDPLYDDDGAYFRANGGEAFTAALHRFGAFRRAIPYGEDGWLTVEEYGRGMPLADTPDSWGTFASVAGRARLVSRRTTDAAILRSTEPLPPRYRLEVTVTNIHFGGDFDPKSAPGGRVNGVSGDEVAEPWMSRRALDNGVYFLCITDYPEAPHNNVFIHHHRKVVMDTDNNGLDGVWSSVFDRALGKPVPDGSRYVSMIFLNGTTYGTDRTGNTFYSYTPGGFFNDPVFADKYRDDGVYVFAVERDADGFTLEASGPFVHGGMTTYRVRHGVRDDPPIWHYNRTPAEYGPAHFDQVRRVGDTEVHTWPEGSSYPDYFFFGDPHINFYEGSAEFDDLRLYVPAP